MSCQEKQVVKTESQAPEFNLSSDLFDFKQKMTDRDTLIISFDHSVCTYLGFERIEVTKKADSLNVISYYNQPIFGQDIIWEKIYDTTITEKDTIWMFEEFLKRNEKTNIGQTKWPLCAFHHKQARYDMLSD